MALPSGKYRIHNPAQGETSTIDTDAVQSLQVAPIISRPETFVPVKWVVKKINGVEGVYIIMKEEHQAIEIEGKLFAQDIFTNAQELPPNAVWRIISREYQGKDLYTITKIEDEFVGWYVPRDISGPDSQLLVGPLVATESLPPQFFPNALFKIEPYLD